MDIYFRWDFICKGLYPQIGMIVKLKLSRFLSEVEVCSLSARLLLVWVICC